MLKPILVGMAVAAVAALFVSLGLWQLDRAEEKQQLLDSFSRRESADAVAWRDLVGGGRDLLHRRIEVTGRFWRERQILRDNQIHDGRAGYHVVTPFVPDGSEAALLIDRGWIPWGPTRDELPRFATPDGTVTITGRLSQPDERTMVLGPEEANGGTWPRVVQKVDIPALSQALGRDLLPFVVRLDPEAEGGFVRDWRPFYSIGPDKHRAYAFQWFTFAILAVLLTVGAALRAGPPPAGDKRD